MTADATYPARPETGADDTGDVQEPAAARRAVAARFAALTCAADPAGGVGPPLAEVPLPGSGRTAARLRTLYELGRADLSLARLAEGHLDAVAILDEVAGAPVGPGERWAVWAARPPGPAPGARCVDGRWLLDGVRPYCAGAHCCTHALVSADAVDGRRLFAVRLAQSGVRPVPGSRRAVGMAGSDACDVAFTAAEGMPVGGVGAYTDRPGSEHAAAGVAACLLGGARAVAETLYASARRRTQDAFAAAHLGAVDTLLSSAVAVLERAARDIDADPLDTRGAARMRGLRVQALAELVCTEVLAHVGRGAGGTPLCHDARHARAAADLAVLMRLHPVERGLAELGRLFGARDDHGNDGGEDER
ncbi:acyl-CoA dehydrogenase [Streptomyces sp. NPDC047002]|uniref:acyl-CoA dehydrogenase n=1 Tax=Streptomyces sp. NPDC047002 TaxID=3155475 RepID=UPI003454234B